MNQNVPAELAPFLNQAVVLDTQGTYVYIGTLENVTADSFILVNADTYDTRESLTTKDKYIHDACKLGVKANRKRVNVFRKDVVGISLLSDIVQF